MASPKAIRHSPGKGLILQPDALHSVSAESKPASTTFRQTSPNLDTLPDELLQQIFRESLELNLVNTCRKIQFSLPPFVCAAEILVAFAFCRVDVARHLDLSQHSGCYCAGLNRPSSERDRKELQKDVLESGWLAIGMLKTAMAAIQEAYLQANWIDTDIKTLPPFRDTIEDYWLDTDGALERDIELYGVSPDGGVRSLVMHDPLYIELNNTDEVDFDLWDRFNVLQVDHIPNKLLEIPITDSKFEFLYLLWRTRSGALNWEIEHSELAMRQAIQHAISTNKLNLTRLLIDLRLRSSSSPVTVEDFVTAAKYDLSHILEIFVDFDGRNLPRNDPDLEQWARSAAEKGDNFGQELLKYMQADDIMQDRHCHL